MKLHPVVRNVMTFSSRVINGSGSPLSWAAYHRLHHAKSDTPEDISSPGRRRLLVVAPALAVAGGLGADLQVLQVTSTSPSTGIWTRIQVPLALLSFFCGLPFGLAALLWLGPIRLTFALHAQCFVNSVSHMRGGGGPRRGTAKNVPWLALMHFGAGRELAPEPPRPPRIGAPRLERRCRIDTGWYAILLFEELRASRRNVRRPIAGIRGSSSLDVAA